MAWVLNLTHGATTVNLVNESGIKVLREDFRPTVGPDKTETGITTDSYRAFINASSVSTLQGFIRSANYAFLMARERQLRNAGDRVYMNVAVDGDSTEYRSEVLDGDVIPDGIYNPNWTNGEAWVTLMITRRNWFEGPETPIKLYNENSTSGTTSGLVIFFCNDASTAATGGIRNNYANITGTDITGDLPGFGILTLVNAADTLSNIFAQYGRTADVTTWWHELGDTTDVTASGGLILQTAFSSSEANIGGTFASVLTGSPYRIISRLAIGGTKGDVYKVIPSISTYFGNTDTLDPVYVTVGGTTSDVVSLGVGMLKNYTSSDIYVYLSVFSSTATTLESDFIMAAPCDVVRDYYLSATSSSNGGSLVDDTVLDTITTTFTAGVAAAKNAMGFNIRAQGNNKILLYPGVNQTMWLAANPWNRDAFVTTNLSYRPRRSTL